MNKHTFRDFVTGKIRFTRGRFEGWTPGTGIIGAKYAIFRTKATEVLIPEYLLTKETKAILAKAEGRHYVI